MDDLSLNWEIFNSLLESVDRNVLSILLLVDLWDILGLVLYGIVVSVTTFTGNIVNDFLILILDHLLLIGDILNSGLSLNGLYRMVIRLIYTYWG
jgi:hypothetical protein